MANFRSKRSRFITLCQAAAKSLTNFAPVSALPYTSAKALLFNTGGSNHYDKVMISSGNPEPVITSVFELLPGVILDQHFLKRNRLARLSSAVRVNPRHRGLGIDEARAIIIVNGVLKVVGDSYVLRLAIIEGQLQVDAYEAGQIIPLISGQ